MKPGEKAQSSNVDNTKMQRQENSKMDGTAGLARTGVKDLSFKMVFIACAVHTADSRFGFKNKQDLNDENQEENLNAFTRNEQSTVIHMKDQPDLYTKLA